MTFLYRYAVRHPRRTLLVAGMFVIAAVPGFTRLKLRTDGHALVPAGAPQVKLDTALRREFGLKDTIVVVVHTDSPAEIFNPQTLDMVDRLTKQFMGIAGLGPADVFSLATEKGRRVKQGTLQFLGFFEPVPSTPEQCITLRDDLRLIKIYDGVLLSADKKSTAIFIGVPEAMERIALYREIQRIIDAMPHAPDTIRVTGAPVAESLLGTHILEDLGVPASRISKLKSEISNSRNLRSLDEVREWIAHHVGVLPIALLLMAIVFLFSFRSFTAAGLTLMKLGMCLLIVFGIMGWLDVPVYLTMAVIPVILTATGVSDEVHIFDRYARQLRERPDDSHVHSLLVTLDEVWRPVVMTSVTTAAGFLSFAISPLAPVRAFGLFTGLGSMICLIWALTATPALVAIINPKRFHQADRAVHRPRGGVRDSPLYGLLGEFVVRRRVAILVAFAILLTVSAIGIRRVYVQDSWIDGFSPASEFHKVTTDFNRQFLGMHVLFICTDTGAKSLTGEIDPSDVDFLTIKLPTEITPDPSTLVGQMVDLRWASPPPDAPPNAFPLFHRAAIESAARAGDRIVASLARTMGSPRFTLRIDAGVSAASSRASANRIRYRIAPEPLLRPEVLRRIKGLEEFIASRRDETVGGTLGPAKYVETTNFIALGCREEFRRIPERDRLEWVWKWYGTIRGAERMRATADPDYARGVISVFMKNANFVDTARLLSIIRGYEREHLAPHGIALSFAGDVAVSQTLIDAITTTQTNSILLSILGVFGSAVLVHRSLRWGLLCAIPCALATPLTFGLMGFANIPLGVATSMFAAMAIGIGDDYAIHFIERFRIESERAPSFASAMRETMIMAGPANVIDALSVALGFSVLILSQVPANARLGIMVAASIVTCLVSTLLLLPAVLYFASPRTDRTRQSHLVGTAPAGAADAS